MLEKQFYDVYDALHELAVNMCQEVDNNCRLCPFYVRIPYTNVHMCILIKAVNDIHNAENRVEVREQYKNNNN